MTIVSSKRPLTFNFLYFLSWRERPAHWHMWCRGSNSGLDACQFKSLAVPPPKTYDRDIWLLSPLTSLAEPHLAKLKISLSSPTGLACCLRFVFKFTGEVALWLPSLEPALVRFSVVLQGEKGTIHPSSMSHISLRDCLCLFSW